MQVYINETFDVRYKYSRLTNVLEVHYYESYCDLEQMVKKIFIFKSYWSDRSCCKLRFVSAFVLCMCVEVCASVIVYTF